VEQALASALPKWSGVHVTTSRQLAALYPVMDYDDPTGDELGHIPYSPEFFTALATLVARKFQASRQVACKVIALDCDQTLWAGVCGEDGPTGIRLDPPRRALQQFLLQQQQAGKLLVICSKNEEADIDAVFAQGPPMPLRKEHFIAQRVNWLPKSENLRSLAHELKLGLESFVFIDDNPLECAEVEAHCPEVLTLQLPEDTSLIPRFLDHCWVFDQLGTTEEDRKRAELYRQNRRREELQIKALSFADFVSELQLKVQIAPATHAQFPRLAQLIQRTNQFNVTGRRRTEKELRQLSGEILAVSVRDRFGDYGLVGALIFQVDRGAIMVDSFLLSCRALGRGVEHQMLAHLGSLAAERMLASVDIHFTPSPRNKPAWEFLEGVGSQFRQALNGGFIYCIPASIARTTAFRPAETTLAATSGFEPNSMPPSFTSSTSQVMLPSELDPFTPSTACDAPCGVLSPGW